MGRFGAKNEDPAIDEVDILLLPREDAVDGWLLSTSTSVFSKMDLSSKPLPPPPPHFNKTSLNSTTSDRAAQCIQSFNCPQYRTSTSSDSSDPEMVEDPPSWSGSESTMEDCHLTDSECWDSYFWSQDKEKMRSPFYQTDVTIAPSCGPESKLSPDNRNYASANLSGLTVNEYPNDLRRSDATRAPRRIPKSLPSNTYSAFPSVCPAKSRYDVKAKSWPARSDSHSQSQCPKRPLLRSRAHTTPTNYIPLPPSNLSTCSTLEDPASPCDSSTSSASGLYMRSAPVSPKLTPPLMELMEKSCFDDDSDDGSDDEGRLAALATRLHIRNTSANSSAPCGKKEKQIRSQKSRRNLKIAGNKVKGILRMKKSSDAA